MTLGVLSALFAAYQLWWTNVVAAHETDQAREQAQSAIDDAPAVPANAVQPPEPVQPPTGKAFALMYIPRLRDKVWDLPVLQGVSTKELARGVGHYPDTALPGEAGNFAVAGHRATHGEPFADFDQLQAGDNVYIETADSWFTYQLRKDRIIAPKDVWVIGVHPLARNELPSDRLITLTTCNPRWASTQRWAFWGELTALQPRQAGPPPGVKL